MKEDDSLLDQRTLPENQGNKNSIQISKAKKKQNKY